MNTIENWCSNRIFRLIKNRSAISKLNLYKKAMNPYRIISAEKAPDILTLSSQSWREATELYHLDKGKTKAIGRWPMENLSQIKTGAETHTQK